MKKFLTRVFRDTSTPRVKGVHCLVYTGAINLSGYGATRYEGPTRRAHRAAWIEYHGPIPKGLNVLHHCDNRPCIEERHLYLGTHQDNVDDRQRRGRQKFHTKLTDAQVRAIIADRRRQVDIAAEYGISQGHVANLKAGRMRVTRRL